MQRCAAVGGNSVYLSAGGGISGAAGFSSFGPGTQARPGTGGGYNGCGSRNDRSCVSFHHHLTSPPFFTYG